MKNGKPFYPEMSDKLAQTATYMQWMVADIDTLLGARDIIAVSWNGALNSGGLADIDLSTRLAAIGGAVVQHEAAAGYGGRLPVVQSAAPAGHLYVTVFKSPDAARNVKTDDSWPMVGAAGEWFTLRAIVWGTPA
jgi:hypothetical protein